MSRLERKCLLASAGAHTILALLLFAVPLLWASPRQELRLPVLTLIPSRLVDGASGGGGSPLAKSLPAPAPAEPAHPLMLAPPPPAPAAEKPVAAITPKASPEPDQAPAKPKIRKSGEPVPSPRKIERREETDDASDGKPSKRKVEISLTRDTSASSKKNSPDARAQAASDARNAQRQFADRVGQIARAIGQGVSSGTSIEVPGPGGEAYADYGQWVVAVYHQAWAPPSDLADDVATVEATVVILRDGQVQSFRVTKRTGNAALDKSVERLQKVRHIAPFPDGALDEKRTFIIDFDLRARKA